MKDLGEELEMQKLSVEHGFKDELIIEWHCFSCLPSSRRLAPLFPERAYPKNSFVRSSPFYLPPTSVIVVGATFGQTAARMCSVNRNWWMIRSVSYPPTGLRSLCVSVSSQGGNKGIEIHLLQHSTTLFCSVLHSLSFQANIITHVKDNPQIVNRNDRRTGTQRNTVSTQRFPFFSSMVLGMPPN